MIQKLTLVQKDKEPTTSFVIDVPDGKEIDMESSTIVFKDVEVEKALPKSWEELEYISGWYANAISSIYDIENAVTCKSASSTFKTEAQAKASIALAQLSQLMAEYNEGWVPDWMNFIQEKYCINFAQEKINIDRLISSRCFLAFKSKAIAEQFAKNFSDLIHQAKPLL